jgi:hypothetical protein
MNALLNELKLDEIIFPPPPLRASPCEDEELDDEDDDWDDEDAALALTPDEVQIGMASLSALDQDRLVRDFIVAFPDVHTFLQEGLFDQQLGVAKRLQPQILALAAQTSFLFFPPAYPAPEIPIAYLKGSLGEIMDAALADEKYPPESFAKQPHVMIFMIERLSEIFGTRASRAETCVTLFFAAFINELHEALYDQSSPES